MTTSSKEVPPSGKEVPLSERSSSWKCLGHGHCQRPLQFHPELTLKHAKSVIWKLTFWDPMIVETVGIRPKTKKKLRGPPPRTIRQLSGEEWSEIEAALYKVKDPFKDVGVRFKGILVMNLMNPGKSRPTSKEYGQ